MTHLALKDIQGFISKNTILAKPGRRCVDGRYPANSLDAGMIARPGADLGYVEILLAIDEEKKLGFSPEQCFDKIFEVLHSLHEKFYLHTDHHADPEFPPRSPQLSSHIGCGHAEKPTDKDLCKDYHLLSEDEEKLVRYAKKRASEDSENIIMVNLPGEHKEEAVLINSGIQKALNSTDGEHMVFLYDKTRDEEFMKVLVEKLDIPQISFEEFKQMSNIQLTATLHNLANSLPIFEVDVDDPENIQIKEVGIVD